MNQLKPLSDEKQKSKPALFAKACMANCIQLSPAFPQTESVEAIRTFLKENLPYNSIETRQRFAAYVINHLFPRGAVDMEFLDFASHFSNTQALRDVCMYRLTKAQPLMAEFLSESLYSAVGTGQLSKVKVKEYITTRLPEARVKSALSTSGAMLEALTASQFVSVHKGNISLRFRKVCLESFAFILYSEFVEAGMYPISIIETSPAFRAMLWSSDDLLPALYELRNRGFVGKVSEIDSVRQFTLEFELDRLVELLVKR